MPLRRRCRSAIAAAAAAAACVLVRASGDVHVSSDAAAVPADAPLTSLATPGAPGGAAEGLPLLPASSPPPPTPTPPPAPPAAPTWADALLFGPVSSVLQHVTCGYRGAAHALRDVLFPSFRTDPAAAAASPGLLDRGFPDEAPGDLALRLAYRDALLRAADAAGVPSFAVAHPDGFRTAVATAAGLLLLAALTAVRLGTAVCARCTLRALFRATGNPMFNDEPGEGTVTDPLSSAAGDPNVFSRMFSGPIEYDFDPRLAALTPGQRAAWEAARRAAGGAPRRGSDDDDGDGEGEGDAAGGGSKKDR
jgi:hypothetical protein